MVVVIQWMIFYSKLLPSHCFELHWNAPGSFSFPLSMCSENHCSMHLIMKSSILGSQHSCSWISFEGWQNPDQCPWFWSLTMKLSSVTLVMQLPEIITIVTQITIFVNPDPKLVHLFTAMWESFKENFTLRVGKRHGRGEGGVLFYGFS